MRVSRVWMRVAMIVALGACGPSDGPYVEKYGNGEVKEEGAFRGGAKTGKWTFYWQDGTIKTEGFYVKGEPDGEWTYYDAKGRAIATGTFRDGRMWDGTHVRYVMGTMKMMRFEDGKEAVGR